MDDLPRVERPAGWVADWSAEAVRELGRRLARFEGELGKGPHGGGEGTGYPWCPQRPHGPQCSRRPRRRGRPAAGWSAWVGDLLVGGAQVVGELLAVLVQGVGVLAVGGGVQGARAAVPAVGGGRWRPGR